MTNAPADDQLVQQCRDGDRGAFTTLLDRYYGVVFNVALRLLSDREDARDVTQVAFLKAYQNLARYDPRYEFRSWVYRIAVNESLNLLKQRNRLEPLDEDRESERRSPEQAAAGAQLRRQVQGALMGLKADYRVVIVLKHFLGCSYQEIGEILQVPEKTVKSRLFSARRQLKERLASKGIV
jgi:RNA polymerase sigma-70 factor (ECF subfamily)